MVTNVTTLNKRQIEEEVNNCRQPYTAFNNEQNTYRITSYKRLRNDECKQLKRQSQNDMQPTPDFKTAPLRMRRG